MRNLFTVDKKDYKTDGTVFERPSVRGIIIKDGKILMIHSLKYDYYKLPGGGIEKGESFEEALIREVNEESGYILKPDSIREFGYVRRISKGMIEDIFIQDNYYFVCEADETQASQNLDDYEADELFTPEFITAELAIKTNKTASNLYYENELGGLNFAKEQFTIYSKPKKRTGPSSKKSSRIITEEITRDL